MSRTLADPTFGEVLGQIMAERELSQYRLSQLSCLGAETICRLVNDVRKPTEAQALRVALALRLSLRETNHLLDAADFYVIPEDLPVSLPSGRPGWPIRQATLTT